MIKVVPGILTGSNDASPTQISMQEDVGYVTRRTVSKGFCYIKCNMSTACNAYYYKKSLKLPQG
jgi:hypothetical protein